MLNLQNNSTYPYVYSPTLHKRYDWKIVATWIEGTLSSITLSWTYRIWMTVINEDWTIAVATTYLPSKTNINGYQHTINIKDNTTFLIESYANTTLDQFQSTTFFTVHKIDENLNVLSSTWRWYSAYYSGRVSESINMFLDYDKNNILVCNRTYNSNNSHVYYNINTLWISESTYLDISRFLQWDSSNIWIFIVWNSIYKLNSSLPYSLLLSSTGWSSDYISKWFNNLKYIFYTKSSDYSYIYYRIINQDSTVISWEYSINTWGTLWTYSNFVQHDLSWANEIYLKLSSNFLLKIIQNLSTWELSLENSTSISSTDIICSYWTNLYLVDTNKSNLIKYVDKSNLNISSQFDITTGSWYTISTFLNQSSAISGAISTIINQRITNWNRWINSESWNEKPYMMNENQMFHNLIYANNGPWWVNNINYQKTQLIFWYASSWTHESINNVYNFNSFKFIPNYNLPNFTDITFYYSLNNWWSWTEITLGMENTIISAPGSTQIKIRSVFNTLDTTVSPEYLDYALELIV